MDLLRDNVRAVYRKSFLAAFGSALISCIYGVVDMRWSAILKPGAAFFVSVARGVVISGALISLLPEVLGPAAIWWAMPVTELLVACYAVSAMRRATRALPSC